MGSILNEQRDFSAGKASFRFSSLRCVRLLDTFAEVGYVSAIKLNK